MTPDPVITDAEVELVSDIVERGSFATYQEAYKAALSAFLKARLPDPISTPHYDPVYGSSGGWNACREAVLKGKP